MNTKTVTIDGKPYSLDSLSETARNQIGNLRVAEQEISRLQALLVMVQTARAAYAQALKDELEKMTPGGTA
jgi:hypothetical protein